MSKETKMQAQQLVNTGVRRGAMVNTNGSWSFRIVAGVDVDDQVGPGQRSVCAVVALDA